MNPELEMLQHMMLKTCAALIVETAVTKGQDKYGEALTVRQVCEEVRKELTTTFKGINAEVINIIREVVEESGSAHIDISAVLAKAMKT